MGGCWGGVTGWFILLYFGLYDSNFKVLATHFGNFWKKKTTIYIQNIPSILVWAKFRYVNISIKIKKCKISSFERVFFFQFYTPHQYSHIFKKLIKNGQFLLGTHKIGKIDPFSKNM